MADKNKLTLILGISLVVVSFLFVVAAFYFIGASGKENSEKINSLEVQLANMIAQKAEGALSSSDYGRVKRGTINLEDVLSKADAIYGSQEMERKEGVLWIDRKVAVFVVTLGRVNGVQEGTMLSIFDGDAKKADVVVVVPYDIVSYVKPAGKTAKDFEKDYYRVVAK